MRGRTGSLGLRADIRDGAAAFALGLAGAGSASAHPHVWVTVQEPDRVHARRQGLGRRARLGVRRDVFLVRDAGARASGELVTARQFAPLAQENAGSLAEIGYFTTLKIGGKAVDFGSVTRILDARSGPTIWSSSMSRCRSKTPAPVGQVRYVAGRRSRILHRLRIRRQETGARWTPRPSGCSASVAKPKSLEAEDKAEARRIRSSPISRPGPISASRWRAESSSRAHDEARSTSGAAACCARPRPRCAQIRRGLSRSAAARAAAGPKAGSRAGSSPNSRGSPT